MPRALHLISSLVFIGAQCMGAPAASVGVFLDFESAPVPSALAVMEKEVETLMKPSGLSLDWRLVRENRGDEPFARLVVLRFKGSCRAEAFQQPAEDFGTLGETRALAYTHVTDGDVTPYGEVECDQVSRALSFAERAVRGGDRQMALGVALARVVAHELYHILARTVFHSTAGLGKASQSLSDLISPRALSFQEGDEQAMRQGRRGLSRAAAAHSGPRP